MLSIPYGLFGIAITSYFLTLLSSSILSGISRCEKAIGQRDADTDISLDSTSGHEIMAAILLFSWLVGGFIYQYLEAEQNWSYMHAIYFLFVSFSTVGFGDLTPDSKAGRVFSMFYLLFGLASTTIILGAIGEGFAEFVETYILNSKDDEEFVLTKVPRIRTVESHKTGPEFDEGRDESWKDTEPVAVL